MNKKEHVEVIKIIDEPLFSICDDNIELFLHNIKNAKEGESWSGLDCYQRLTLLSKHNEGALVRFEDADRDGNHQKTKFYWVDWS